MLLFAIPPYKEMESNQAVAVIAVKETTPYTCLLGKQTLT
jgi:hypothetical protein